MPAKVRTPPGLEDTCLCIDSVAQPLITIPVFGPGAGLQGWGKKISACLSFSVFWPVRTVPSLPLEDNLDSEPGETANYLPVVVAPPWHFGKRVRGTAQTGLSLCISPGQQVIAEG